MVVISLDSPLCGVCLFRSEIRWLYQDVTRHTKNCSVWSAFESVLPLWWWPAHLSRDNSGGSATTMMNLVLSVVVGKIHRLSRIVSIHFCLRASCYGSALYSRTHATRPITTHHDMRCNMCTRWSGGYVCFWHLYSACLRFTCCS